jgi:hypothetical protein
MRNIGSRKRDLASDKADLLSLDELYHVRSFILLEISIFTYLNLL